MKKTPWQEYATRKPRVLKQEAAQHGFDLTQFDPGGFAKVITRFSISPMPRVEQEYGPTGLGPYYTFYWTGPGITIITTNDPNSGEPHGPKGYAGYIGIEGDDDKVRQAAMLIKAHADVKDESPGMRAFAHRQRTGAKQEVIQIRASTYRGEPGFTVSGTPTAPGTWAFPIKIFTKTREGAEKIRDLYKDPSLTDQQRQDMVNQILLRGEGKKHEQEMDLMVLAQKVRDVYERASRDLGADLGGFSVLDLMADQFPFESLRSLEDAIVVAGLGHLGKYSSQHQWRLGESLKREQKFQIGDRVKFDPSSGLETQVPAGVGGTIVDGPEDYGEGPLWEVEWDDDPETSREPEASLMPEARQKQPVKNEHVLEVMPDESELAGRLIAASPMKIGLVEPSRNPPSRMVYYLDGSESDMSDLIDKMYEAGIEPYTAEVTPMEEGLKHETFWPLPGDRVKVVGGSGLDSGRTGTVVPAGTIPTDGRGVPLVSGAYKPIDRSKEVEIQWDSGSYGIMYKDRLTTEGLKHEYIRLPGTTRFPTPGPVSFVADVYGGNLDNLPRNPVQTSNGIEIVTLDAGMSSPSAALRSQLGTAAYEEYVSGVAKDVRGEPRSEDEFINAIADIIARSGVEIGTPSFEARERKRESKLRTEQVGQTIYQQLRGMDPMALMAWGAKDFVELPSGWRHALIGIPGDHLGGLMFRVRGPKMMQGGKIIVLLNGRDLYDVYAGRVRGADWSILGEVHDVYFDQLIQVIDGFVG